MKSAQAPKKMVSVTKEVTWKVPNYSKTNFIESKTFLSIKSNTFTVSNAGVKTKWFLNLYLFPNVYRVHYNPHIGLYLNSASPMEAGCIDFNIKFRFGVLKKNHEKYYFEDEMKQYKEEMEKYGFGPPIIFSKAELFDEAKGYFVDETLTFLAELKVEYEVENVKAQTRVGVFTALSAKMKEDYKKMFENDALADFQLKVSGGEVLKAHKFVLAARSPVFFAMLTNDMKESKDGSVDVPDIDSTVMKEVLRFIYYNEIEGLEQIAPELIFAAEKYQLDELKEICLEEILSALEVQNVIESLNIAHQIIGAEELFNGCMDLILSNYSEVRRCPSWKELPNELVTMILDESLERNMAI